MDKLQRNLSQAERDIIFEKKVQILVELYREASEKLDQVRNGVFSWSRNPTTESAKSRAEDLLRQIRTIVNGLDSEVKTWAQKSMPEAYNLGVDLAGQQLRDLGESYEGNIFAKIHTQSVDVLVQQMVNDLLVADGSINRNFNGWVRSVQQNILTEQQINRIIAQGQILGQSRKQVSDQILTAMNEKMGKGGYMEIKGRFYHPEKYAEMLARTRTREAATQGAINANIESGNDLVQVSRHSTSCPICQPFEGRVFSISGTHPDFPRLIEKPPFHPNCKHVLLPALEEILKMRGYYDSLVKLGKNPNAKVSTMQDWKEALAA